MAASEHLSPEQMKNRTFDVLYHATSSQNMENIRETGLRAGSARNAGRGIYLTQTEDEARRYGEVTIPVQLARDTKIHPNPYDDPSVAHLVGEGTGPEEWEGISDVLRSQGWHGHVDDQGGGKRDHIVLYDSGRATIIK